MLLDNLNPRKHIAAGIGWAVFTIIALAAPVCAWLVAKETENYFRQSATQSLQQNAVQIHREVAANLESRLSIIQLTASQLSPTPHNSSHLKLMLNSVHRRYPEINWIGLADSEGTVVTSANNVFVGESSAEKSWFTNGSKGAYLGDVRNEPSLQKLLPRRSGGSSFKVIDVAFPVNDGSGKNTGVVGAHLSWNWVRNLQALSLSNVESNRLNLQLILASEDNTVISGPADLIGKPLPGMSALKEDGKYLLGIERSAYNNNNTLDWTVAVRTDSAQAISIGRSAQRIVILTIMGAGTIAALLIVFAVSRLTRKLRLLSVDAEKIADGEEHQIRPMDGSDEVSQISRLLATSIDGLQQEKQTLVALNSELDQRVELRTKDIERLSAESREIALTQQRLRFARDMHDTLAHSMMAVLTQIRLVRKIRTRLSDNDVEEELRRAEDVALKGLTEARAAIAQVRTNNVLDKGISGAMHELVERFRARSGIRFTLDIDPHSVRQEDNRGETIYRITEEALRNIEKHARANEVNISLKRIEPSANDNNSNPIFQLEVIDDGIGFNTDNEATGHYGLIGLREQAALINGELIIDSVPGNGTSICLRYTAYPA